MLNTFTNILLTFLKRRKQSKTTDNYASKITEILIQSPPDGSNWIISRCPVFSLPQMGIITATLPSVYWGKEALRIPLVFFFTGCTQQHSQASASWCPKGRTFALPPSPLLQGEPEAVAQQGQDLERRARHSKLKVRRSSASWNLLGTAASVCPSPNRTTMTFRESWPLLHFQISCTLFFWLTPTRTTQGKHCWKIQFSG